MNRSNVLRACTCMLLAGAALCCTGAAMRDDGELMPVLASDYRLGRRMTMGQFDIGGRRMEAYVYIYRVMPDWLMTVGGAGRMVVEVRAVDGKPTNLKIRSARVEQLRYRWSPKLEELASATGAHLVPPAGQWWVAYSGPRLAPGKNASVKLEFTSGRTKKTVKLTTVVGQELIFLPTPPFEGPIVRLP